MSDLIVVNQQTKAIDIFQPQKVDDVIGKIKEEVNKFKGDISTKKGRDEIASMAYKISRSKTFLDKLGKELGEDARKQIDLINVERRKINSELDFLRDEVRKPLTDWEDAEKKRISDHESEIKFIIDLSLQSESGFKTLTVEDLKINVDRLNSYSRVWEEFESRALEVLEMAKFKAQKALDSRLRFDSEQAELLRQKTEAEEKARKEREESIAKEAAEKAKRDAELKAKAEAEKIERERLAEIERVESEKKRIQQEKDLAEARAKAAEQAKIDAEKRAIEAAKRAEEDKKKAIAAEKIRLEKEAADKKAKEQAEIEKREANKRHVAKINNEAVKALLSSLNIDESLAKEIVVRIAKGMIPNVKISY